MLAHCFDLLSRFRFLLLITSAGMIISSCGGGQSSNGGGGGGVEHLFVTVNPSSATVPAGQSQQFTASVTGSTNQSVTWSVNQVDGGSATLGTISAIGLYTAPSIAPTPNTVTVAARSNADNTATARAQVTITTCGGTTGQPGVTLNPPAPGASQLSGTACNVDHNKIKVVIYVLTNQWYVQPFVSSPFTDISADGSWSSFTHPWEAVVVLLVDPATYTPAATEITNPALDPNVTAWTTYPPGPISVSFSGRTWGIKTTGTSAGDQFDPGPNFWSNDPSVVSVVNGALHLMINQINGTWYCGEAYLTQSLGYGTYTVQVASHLDQLDQNTVAAPLFIYAQPGQELDNEYSGLGGLVLPPYNAQFVVQPYNVPGNIMYYLQPSTAQFTTQMEWRSDHVTFTAWKGWASTPAPGDIISQWTYTGEYIPPVGQERVHINLWLLHGSAPLSGKGDEMVVNSFTFQP